MKLLLFLLSIFLFIFIAGYFNDEPQNFKIANNVSYRAAKKIQNKYHPHFNGAIWRTDKENGLFNKINISFSMYGEVNIIRAREIILDIIHVFMSDINNNEILRKYLNGQFLHSNITVSVYIYDEERGDIYDPNLGMVLYDGKEISYFSEIENIVPLNLKLEETYEEALQKVQHHEIKR